MGPELPIRVAPEGAFKEVARLLGGFRDYYGESTPTDEEFLESVPRLLADPDTEFIVAGDPGIGIIQVRFRFSVWTGQADCWIEDVFVEPDARGAGAGRAMVRAVRERARLRGCKRIQLDVNERNEQAIGLYESLGYRSGSPDRFDGGRDLYMTCRL